MMVLWAAYLDFLGTRDDNEVVPLSQDPRKRDLTGSSVVLDGDFLDTVDYIENLWEVLLRKSLQGKICEVGIRTHDNVNDYSL